MIHYAYLRIHLEQVKPDQQKLILGELNSSRNEKYKTKIFLFSVIIALLLLSIVKWDTLRYLTMDQTNINLLAEST